MKLSWVGKVGVCWNGKRGSRSHSEGRGDRLVDLRDRATAVPQGVEMRLHICAFDVADSARSESRQLLVRLGKEPECRLGLILHQGADVPIVGAAIIQGQIGHFLEPLALGRADVLPFFFAFSNFRRRAVAWSLVPRMVCQSFCFAPVL